MATYQDARLIIELSKWAQDWGFHESNQWIRSLEKAPENYREFASEYPPGSKEHRHPFTVLGYFENIGLFLKHEVVD